MSSPHTPAPPSSRGCNVFAGLDRASAAERIEPLVTASAVRIERIVSTGQASPPGFWYDQDWDEWVVVLCGAAGLLIEGEAKPRVLGPGDSLYLAAHLRHRVQWTSAAEPTVWLAVHHLP